MSRAWETATKVAFADEIIEILENYDTWSNLEACKDDAWDEIIMAAIRSQGVNLG